MCSLGYLLCCSALQMLSELPSPNPCGWSEKRGSFPLSFCKKEMLNVTAATDAEFIKDRTTEQTYPNGSLDGPGVTLNSQIHFLGAPPTEHPGHLSQRPAAGIRHRPEGGQLAIQSAVSRGSHIRCGAVPHAVPRCPQPPSPTATDALSAVGADVRVSVGLGLGGSARLRLRLSSQL